MKFIINKFAIISPVEKKAYEVVFSLKTNLIVGIKDTGKSTLARAIMYTLGCDVKDFDLLESSPNNIYIITFTVEENEYILLRKRLKKGKGKNYFKIYKNKIHEGTFYSTKEFTTYLNKIFNILVVTIDKNLNETLLYPNHIFLPFYTDQDNSWQNYLTSTFHNMAFIKDYKKLILEYFVGARTNEYYELKLNQSKLFLEYERSKALLLSKEIIYQENLRNIKIIESINLEDFKSQYGAMLALYKNVVETEHKLKQTINEKLYLKNSYVEAKAALNTNIEMFNEEIDKQCPNCHQTMLREFEENYSLYVAKENLITEREKIEMALIDCESELETEIQKLAETKVESLNIQNTLNNNSELVNLAERADSYALSRINLVLEKEIADLKVKSQEVEEAKKNIDSRIRKLKEKDIAKDYKELMKYNFDKLSIPFSYKSFYDSNFESVKIALSGTTKVQAFIAQYLSILEIVQKNKSVIKIPMFIDSYIKDHFTDDDIKTTTNFIFEKLYDISHQSFVFISDSKFTLSFIDMSKVNYIQLEGKNALLKDRYEEVQTHYSEYIGSTVEKSL